MKKAELADADNSSIAENGLQAQRIVGEIQPGGLMDSDSPRPHRLKQTERRTRTARQTKEDRLMDASLNIDGIEVLAPVPDAFTPILTPEAL